MRFPRQCCRLLPTRRWVGRLPSRIRSGDALQALLVSFRTNLPRGPLGDRWGTAGEPLASYGRHSVPNFASCKVGCCASKKSQDMWWTRRPVNSPNHGSLRLLHRTRVAWSFSPNILTSAIALYIRRSWRCNEGEQQRHRACLFAGQSVGVPIGSPSDHPRLCEPERRPDPACPVGGRT